MSYESGYGRGGARKADGCPAGDESGGAGAAAVQAQSAGVTNSERIVIIGVRIPADMYGSGRHAGWISHPSDLGVRCGRGGGRGQERAAGAGVVRWAHADLPRAGRRWLG